MAHPKNWKKRKTRNPGRGKARVDDLAHVLADPAIRLVTANMVLKDTVDNARASRKKRITLERLLLEDADVRTAFSGWMTAMLQFIHAAHPQAALDAPTRLRPVPGRASEPRRTPVRGHGGEEPEEEGV